MVGRIYLFTTSPKLYPGYEPGGCLIFVSVVSTRGKHFKKRAGPSPLSKLRNSIERSPQDINEECSEYKIHMLMELTCLAFV
jgi:hypothetical protein